MERREEETESACTGVCVCARVFVFVCVCVCVCVCHRDLYGVCVFVYLPSQESARETEKEMRRAALKHFPLSGTKPERLVPGSLRCSGSF